jgi:peptide-methionine (S)-S-oxide reductase
MDSASRSSLPGRSGPRGSTGLPRLVSSSTSEEEQRDERRRRDRDPRGRLLLGRTGAAAPPRRSHLHTGRIHRWGERQPDRRGPWGHAEAVEIVFDPERISYRDILEFFFQIHDPTTKDRQGEETGSYVRSEIFYTSDEQRQVAEDTIADVEASGLWPGKVVTEISEASRFWEAEAEDQGYFQRHRDGETCHFPRPDWKLPHRETAA